MSNNSLTGWCILNIAQHPRKTLCFESRVFAKTVWVPEEEWKESTIWCQKLWAQVTVLPLVGQAAFDHSLL
jgi:hypothetical protein